MDVTKFTCARPNEFKDLLLKRHPAARPINDGFAWLSGAMSLFAEKLITWLGMATIITIISSTIFLVAHYFLPEWNFNQAWQPLAGFCFIGGLLVSAASQAEQNDLSLGYLFSGFRYKFMELFTLYVLTICLVGIPFATLYLFMPDILSATNDILWGSPAVIFTVFAMVVFAVMILWFAPALIVLHDIAPWTAIKMSLNASRSNLLTIFAFCLMASVIGYGIYYYIPKIAPMLIGTLGINITIALTVFLSSLMIVFGALILYVAYRNVWTNLEIE